MTYPERVIDVHTHIFNANHLPIQGLILTYTGYAGTGGSGDRTRLWLARTAARLIADLIGDGSDEWMRAGFVPFAADEGAIGEEVLISEMHQRIVDRSSAALWSLQGGEGLTAEARLQRIDAESLLKNLVEIELGYQESMATSGGVIVHPPSIDEIEATFEVLKRSVELASTSGQLVGASFFSRWALRWLLKLIGSLIERWGRKRSDPSSNSSTG